MTPKKRFTMVRSWIKNRVEQATGMYIYKRNELQIGACLFNDIKRFMGSDVSLILDVGANVGQSAKLYSDCFANAKIYSFEPFSEAYEELRHVASTISNIIPQKIALADKDNGLRVIKSPVFADSTNSLRIAKSECKEETEFISSMRLDTWLDKEKIRHVDFMKVDVEGFELKVIIGAEQAFSNNRVSLALFEAGIGLNNTWNTSLCEIIEAMHRHRYELIGLYDTSLVQLKNKTHYTNALFASQALINSLPPLTTEITNKSWPFQAGRS